MGYKILNESQKAKIRIEKLVRMKERMQIRKIQKSHRKNIFVCFQVGTCVWARDSGRKGCVSLSDPEQPRRKKNPVSTPDQATEKTELVALENGFKCPGGKLGKATILYIPHLSSGILKAFHHLSLTLKSSDLERNIKELLF